MPYMRHQPDQPPEQGVSYPDASTAHAAKEPGDQVTFVISDDEREDWFSREYERFENGTYIKVPWSRFEPYDGFRFPHLSLEMPGLMAYTKSPEHGYLDRQTRVRPGKYLNEYFSQWGKQTIDQYISECQAENMELRIARSTDEIVHVYLNGPSSCMSHPAENFPTEGIHPVSVYGESDLGIAWYGTKKRVSARAIVWPDKQLYGRIYGGATTLEQMLERAGYQQGSMRGAKVRVISLDNGAYLMPYVDGIDSASIRRIGNKTWAVLGTGDLCCQRTDGLSQDPEEEEEEDDNSWMCSFCDGAFNSDYESGTYVVNYGTICDHCLERRFFQCANCAEYRRNPAINGASWCSACFEREANHCAVTDCAARWLSDEDDDRDLALTDHICADHIAEGFVYCEECSQAISITLNDRPYSATHTAILNACGHHVDPAGYGNLRCDCDLCTTARSRLTLDRPMIDLLSLEMESSNART